VITAAGTGSAAGIAIDADLLRDDIALALQAGCSQARLRRWPVMRPLV
jgi:hypothetical protein